MALITRKGKAKQEQVEEVASAILTAQNRAKTMPKDSLLAYVNTTIYALGRALSDYERPGASSEQRVIDLSEAIAQERVLRALLSELLAREDAGQ